MKGQALDSKEFFSYIKNYWGGKKKSTIKLLKNKT